MIVPTAVGVVAVGVVAVGIVAGRGAASCGTTRSSPDPCELRGPLRIVLRLGVYTIQKDNEVR